jgi:hypothetical protein
MPTARRDGVFEHTFYLHSSIETFAIYLFSETLTLMFVMCPTLFTGY